MGEEDIVVFNKLFLVMIVVPVMELYILIEIGQYIGVVPTIGIIILTGFIGAYLVKNQGFKIFRKIQDDLLQNIIPGDNLLQGAIVLAGGILLITPGFLTDVAGFIFLIPVTRQMVKKYLLLWLRSKIKSKHIYFEKF
jgi:UPF0716 protein FxsA